jgi:hypothetical protein
MLKDDKFTNKNIMLTNHQVFTESIQKNFFLNEFLHFFNYLDGITQDAQNKKGTCQKTKTKSTCSTMGKLYF